MTERTLEVIEEQEAAFSIGSETWVFRFYAFRNLMYVDISQGEEYVVAGKRVLPNKWLLPRYIAEGIGNFRFETYSADEDDYVWWEEFNAKFRLVSYTDEEIKEMEADQKG